MCHDHIINVYEMVVYVTVALGTLTFFSFVIWTTCKD
jgi:hypothetical protein